MPLKYKKSSKRNTKKFVKKSYKKRSNKKLVNLIKKVALRPVETKHTHFIGENFQLFHNVPDVQYAHLNTVTAVTDDNTGVQNFSCRIGDEVIARGLSYKFWFASKQDRPNVMYKIVFFKYQSREIPASIAPYYQQGTANYFTRDLNTEKYKIVKVVQFNLETSGQRMTATDTFQPSEGHKYISVWLPMGNKKIRYENNTSVPSFQDYGYTVVAYDSYGTLTTDNIASYAVNRKFYFKDP